MDYNAPRTLTYDYIAYDYVYGQAAWLHSTSGSTILQNPGCFVVQLLQTGESPAVNGEHRDPQAHTAL